MAYLTAAGAPVRADFPKPASAEVTRPYSPIAVTTLTFREPRPLRVWVVRIDLIAPDVEVVVTPRAKNTPGFQTLSATTPEFAKEKHLQMAINASPYGPVRKQSGEGVNIIGLSASRGDVYAPPSEQYGSLIFDRQGKAAVLSPPVGADKIKEIWNGVGGFAVVARAGKNVAVAVATKRPERLCIRARRPASRPTGIRSRWVVVDGRQGIGEG